MKIEKLKEIITNRGGVETTTPLGTIELKINEIIEVINNELVLRD